MKVRSEERPVERYEIQGEGERVTLILNDLASVDEVDGMYEWQQYYAELMNNAEQIAENIEELFELAKQKEYDELAEKVREKRNKLLQESDAYMCLDRLNLDTSSAIKFLASLKNIFQNNYATYRQALRDITDQPGFPYDVEFPEKPE